MTRKLALYHHEGCGPCWRVRRAIDELGLDVELRHILLEPQRRRELIQNRGRATVPVLRIEDESGVIWMPESRDIVEYLRSIAAERP